MPKSLKLGETKLQTPMTVEKLLPVLVDMYRDIYKEFASLYHLHGVEISTITANYTFYPIGHRVFMVTPDSSYNFNPDANSLFPDEYLVEVFNMATVATKTLAFDSTGINSPIAVTERGMFIYDLANTIWVKVYVGTI